MAADRGPNSTPWAVVHQFTPHSPTMEVTACVCENMSPLLLSKQCKNFTCFGASLATAGVVSDRYTTSSAIVASGSSWSEPCTAAGGHSLYGWPAVGASRRRLQKACDWLRARRRSLASPQSQGQVRGTKDSEGFSHSLSQNWPHLYSSRAQAAN